MDTPTNQVIAQQQQRQQPRCDYAATEQVEIGRLVYAAYGLDTNDVREVEI